MRTRSFVKQKWFDKQVLSQKLASRKHEGYISIIQPPEPIMTILLSKIFLFADARSRFAKKHGIVKA